MQRKVAKNVKQVDFSGKRKKKSKRSNKRIPYAAFAKQVYGDLKSIKNMFNIEDKYIDVLNGGSGITNTAVLTLLNGLTLGTTGTTRSGQSIKAVDLQFNSALSINGSATSSFFRLLIFRDESPNGLAPTAANVLQVNNNFLAPRLVEYNIRFHVFHDELFALSINGQTNLVITRLIKLGFHTEFNTGNTGLVADITRNSLYMLVLCNEPVNGIIQSYYSRFSFVDN